MKIKITVILFMATFLTTAQNKNYERWETIAEKDISLQPEYGNFDKNESQKEDDEKFKKDILEYYKGDTNLASKKMAELGFQYLYDKGDFATAMRRFNQAYMLNSQNADAYYGFGTIYFNLGNMDKAREQYDKGLEIDPKHSKMLTDYGTTYLGDYYESLENGKENSIEFLTKADEYLEKSLEFDKKDSNTIYKLSIVNMYLGNCIEAKSFLEKAKRMNNPNITESFQLELEESCNNDNIDCSSIRTGKFIHTDPEIGKTIITRTEKFQIEEYEKTNYKLKLEINWINDCTYTLKPVKVLSGSKNNKLPTMILTCTVTYVTDNEYTQISKSETNPRRLKTELKIIK